MHQRERERERQEMYMSHEGGQPDICLRSLPEKDEHFLRIDVNHEF